MGPHAGDKFRKCSGPGATAGLSSSAGSTVGQANRGTRQLGCVGLLVAAASISHALVVSGAPPRSCGQIPWATGSQLSQTLAQPLDVFWSNNPLRDAVASLSRAAAGSDPHRSTG